MPSAQFQLPIYNNICFTKGSVTWLLLCCDFKWLTYLPKNVVKSSIDKVNSEYHQVVHHLILTARFCPVRNANILIYQLILCSQFLHSVYDNMFLPQMLIDIAATKEKS